MKKLLMLFFLMAIGLGFTLGEVSWVLAQEAKTEEFTLEEITVTAQKRVENQQKVSIAMEVISGADLTELGKTDVDQILSSVSTAFIARTADGTRVSLRGIGYDTPAGYGFGTGAVPGTVSVNLDGIYTPTNPTGTGIYDIERVEVLFGPQSTTYASNAPGGIVNINTVQPKLGAYEATGILEYGTFNLLHTEGSLNVPVSDTLALRAAFNTLIRDGYLSNGGDDDDQKAARLRALWKPTDNFSILVTGEYQIITSRGASSVPGFKKQDDVADPWRTTQPLTGTPQKSPDTKINAQIDYDFGFGVMTIVPSYDRSKFEQNTAGLDFTGASTTGVATGNGYNKGFEARLASPSNSSIKWIVGVNTFRSNTFRHSIVDYPTSGLEYMYNFESMISEKAILGNITYPATDQFRLIAGGRYSKDRAMSSMTVIKGQPFESNTLSDQSYKHPDYKLGMEYDLSKEAMLYANWATSFRVEQEAQSWRNIAFPAQKMTAYQAGLKSRFFDNRFQLNPSLYYYDYKNRIYVIMQQLFIDPATGLAGPPGPGKFPGPPDQGGRAPGHLRMYGADIQTSTIISSQDKLDLSVSYLDSLLKTLSFDYQFLPDVSYNDRVPTDSPKWTINLNYSHVFNFSNGSAITASYDTRYQTHYIISLPDTFMGTDYHGYKDQEAHHIDNLNLVYANSDGKWTLSAYVKNMWNYAEKRFMDMPTQAGPNMTVGPPRTYGGVLSVKF
jgi:iron complex outermembrane recepter protein